MKMLKRGVNIDVMADKVERKNNQAVPALPN